VSLSRDDFFDTTNENELLRGDNFFDGYVGIDSSIADSFTDDVFLLWDDQKRTTCSPSKHPTTRDASATSHVAYSSFANRISYLEGVEGR
jgi:hypothetical protein